MGKLDEQGSKSEEILGNSGVKAKNCETNDLVYGKRRCQKDFFYCEELVQCFGRHIIRNHSQESEVQRILS